LSFPAVVTTATTNVATTVSAQDPSLVVVDPDVGVLGASAGRPVPLSAMYSGLPAVLPIEAVRPASEFDGVCTIEEKGKVGNYSCVPKSHPTSGHFAQSVSG
jgi:D-serine deaminase-like pyridoxal phosphate-dependent protein